MNVTGPEKLHNTASCAYAASYQLRKINYRRLSLTGGHWASGTCGTKRRPGDLVVLSQLLSIWVIHWLIHYVQSTIALNCNLTVTVTKKMTVLLPRLQGHEGKEGFAGSHGLPVRSFTLPHSHTPTRS